MVKLVSDSRERGLEVVSALQFKVTTAGFVDQCFEVRVRLGVLASAIPSHGRLIPIASARRSGTERTGASRYWHATAWEARNGLRNATTTGKSNTAATTTWAALEEDPRL